MESALPFARSNAIDLSVLMPRPDADREAAIAADVALYRLIGSPGFEISEDDRVRDAAAKVARAYHPAGTVRQLAAIVTAADRTPSLRTLQVPTVVIHGEADRLIDVSGGRATAAAVPGAELVLIPGMSHDLPEGAWDRIVDAIATNTAKA
jgi:pimeloyl-ACP methyl ester carboxylesterase